MVTSLCARVGIPSADIDVAELTDQVKGMALGRQMPVRGALELLAVTYNFDCAESDYKLVCKKRGRDPVRALTEDDLVAERQELIVEERAQDVDLPLRVSLNYQDHDRDAEPASQTAQRIKNPNPTMYSDSSQSIELPITLTAHEAREIVVRQCFAPWAERTKLEFALSQAHLDLDPGDVVTLLLDSGRQRNLRAVVMGIGRDLSIRLEAVTESSSSYDVSSVQASGGVNYRSVIAAPTSAGRLILADSPLLADSHDAGRAASGVYWFMGGIGQPGWQGALLFESADGALYALVGEGLEEASWGTLTSGLDPPSTTGLYAIDTVNAVQIRPVTFVPSEVTELEMLNGATRMLIVDAGGSVEVIAFQNVTDDGDGYYTLDGLMRALRGTEAGHPAGALFVLLPSDPDSMERAGFALAALDTPRSYKAPGRGATLADAHRRAITPVGRDLMPYRPVQLTSDGAAWGSDIELSWVRQTRVGGHGWPDGITEDVPLAEDSEAYELEVLDGPGGSVVRTATGLTSPSFTYTTAMQSADFVGSQTELTFRVYQVSAQVGRGFASAERTVDT